ncbi:uncharacterized protein LOC126835757 isoform X2 [Adelges cooleyi]|uniref:uncharacterized protein LOC126835757 isoform X2 n=1 Tax=Adelges cooleyi TaxID=133065 RepID=UPI00217F405A|nr:uncharacterized protein LOC126835757 isoform X2 [Adelges cooleyi]
MEKAAFLLFMLISNSFQRPQLDVNVSTTVEPVETTEDNTEKVLQVTEATAVSVKSTINVSSVRPIEVFEDFQPSNYYRPDGNPIFEKPSPPVRQEIFYKPSYFNIPPSHLIYQLPKRPDTGVVFPQATQEHYSEHQYNKSQPPEFRSPMKYGEVLPQFKPIKHDSGEITPNFNNDFNDKNVRNYHGNEMAHYPDIVHEPPMSYHHSLAKKKVDPWKSVLKVMASLLPIGILFASFPPTVIRVNSTQNPYQVPKNVSHYPSTYNSIYKALKKKAVGRNVENAEDKFSDDLDECSKRKLCENLKLNYSITELESLLQEIKYNSTEPFTTSMTNIIKLATHISIDSCQEYICNI